MAVLHGDATLAVATIIDAATTAAVVTRVPNPRPPAFVLIRRTGGTARGVVVDDAQVTVESWAATDEASHDLAQIARQALHAAAEAGTGQVRRVQEFSGPALLPDPESLQPRHSQTFSVSLRATA
jgi:metal-dependent amidase/aminoacylase/carboxypeptidase family protein